jgi:hypothetical protein
MSRLRTIGTVAVVFAAAADDLLSAWIGIRPIRWHIRRLVDVARRAYRIAVYGEPSDSMEVEPMIYDVELLEEPR